MNFHFSKKKRSFVVGFEGAGACDCEERTFFGSSAGKGKSKSDFLPYHFFVALKTFIPWTIGRETDVPLSHQNQKISPITVKLT